MAAAKTSDIIMEDGLLTDKQQRFVDEYLIDLNAKQAAIRSGYSAKTAEQQGSRLLSNAKVRDAVEAGKAKVANRIEVTQDYVLSTIVSTVERCKQSEEVRDRKGDIVLTETADGSVVPAYVFNANGVLKGAELLGKYLGMFTEKVEHTGKDGGPIQFTNKDRAQRLLFLLAQARASK